MASTEKQTQLAIMEYLDIKGIFNYRQNSGSMFIRGHMYKFASISGLPDIVAIKDGVYYAIEVKDEKKSAKQNKNQIQFQRLLEKAGGVYVLARTIDDIIEIFDK